MKKIDLIKLIKESYQEILEETKPVVSYKKAWGDDGTVYGQTIRIDKPTFEKLKDAVQSEITLKYPRRSEYSWETNSNIYLKPLKMSPNGVVELNLTQARFIDLFLKLKLKDRNTRLVVKGSKADQLKEDFSIADQPNSDYVSELVDTATNESKFYDTKDAKGAIEYAKKVLIKEKMENMRADFDKATPEAIKELTKYWKNN